MFVVPRQKSSRVGKEREARLRADEPRIDPEKPIHSRKSLTETWMAGSAA
jgi:hypothetical protein